MGIVASGLNEAEKEDVVLEVPPFQPLRVILVGLGGIGSKLADELARFLMYTEKAPKEMVLVDGDTYSQSNLDRQSVLESDVGKPKAQVWSDSLAMEFHKVSFSAMCGYVVPDDFRTQKDMSVVVPISRLQMEGAITILGVDNHKTRKLFSDHFQKFVQNGVLINGGNKTEGEGSIITAVRINGEQIMPAIDTFHPEIKEPKDKNPGELSCAELAKQEGGTQIIWANQMVAALIGNEVYGVVRGDWKNLRQRGEVYFDITANAAAPRARFVPGKEIEYKGDAVKVEPKEAGETSEVPMASVSQSISDALDELTGGGADGIHKVRPARKKASRTGPKVVNEPGKPTKKKAAVKAKEGVGK
jgi:hypothetical protein